MQNTHSFGVCLKNMLENRDLSVVEASRLLSMKSPTSLARILHDEVNIKTLERFYHQLMQADYFSLTEEEKNQLSEAFKIQSLGQDEYLAQQSLWKLLLPASEPLLPSPRLVYFQKNLSFRPEALAQLFSLYAESKKAHLILCGCCLPCLISALPHPLPDHITVTHYLRAHTGSAHSLSAALAAIYPLLPQANYSAFIADREKLPPEAIACYGKNEFLCAFEDSQGKQHWHHGILWDSNQISLIEYRCEAQFAFHVHPLTRYQARLEPVKPLFFSSPQPECYVDYIRYFQQLEHDREIYCLKPDLPMHFIHPDLLLAATLDALPGAPFGNASQLEDLLKRMYALQAQRWKNIFKKRKVTHIIFSFQAMLEFARTGVQTDHFFGMRPFAPSERKSILVHLRRQMQENPYFNIHFAFPEMIPFQLELCGYDSGDVLLSSITTSYDLSTEYMDAMIRQQDFFKTYKNFFLHELLPSRVHSGKETLAMMDQVIEAIPEE